MQKHISIECPPELLIGLHTDAWSFGKWMKTHRAVGQWDAHKYISFSKRQWFQD